MIGSQRLARVTMMCAPFVLDVFVPYMTLRSRRVVLVRQFADARQQLLDRLGLRRLRESAQQLFAQVDRILELMSADQLLNANFQLLPFLDLGVLLQRADLFLDA